MRRRRRIYDEFTTVYMYLNKKKSHNKAGGVEQTLKTKKYFILFRFIRN